MKRMWVLYGLFFCIMLFCVVLFFSNFIAAEDSYPFNSLSDQMNKKHTYGLCITDLHRSDNLSKYEISLPSPDKELEITARVHSYDIAVMSPTKQNVNPKQIQFVIGLQVFAVVAMAAIFVLVVVLLVSFYRVIRQGRVFQRRGITWLRVLGILMLLMSLSVDLSVYIERDFAYQLLSGTQWAPQHQFTLHFTRIFFSIIILFVAEILNLGQDMQEEQDLTI